MPLARARIVGFADEELFNFECLGVCVKSRKLYALKGQHHIAQGSALGIMVYIMNNAPCKGNSLIIRLLPLQGEWRCVV